MRCYCRQGQPYLALRQYYLCVETLQIELEITATEETMSLYQQIRDGKSI